MIFTFAAGTTVGTMHQSRADYVAKPGADTPASVRKPVRETARPKTRATSRPAQETLAKTANTFNEVAQNAASAVVSISVIKSNPLPGKHESLLPFPPSESNDPAQKSQGIGSGVIIRKDGYILTNNHVIENAEKITIKIDEKHKINAQVKGTDPKTDLAVLKMDGPARNYPTLEFGDSAKIKVGDWAIAIGSPFGLNRSMSKGIISAIGRAQMGILDIEDFIQTDAAINPGSSGGPLLNTRGEMIGINTAIFSQGGGFVGIGFAIPAEIAKEVADQLIAHGQMRRGWIGISVQDLDEDLARYFHAPSVSGALITEVAQKSPAARALLQPGDVVIRYDNRAIETAFDIKAASSRSGVGSTVTVEIARNGALKTLNVKVEEQPRPAGSQEALRQKAGKISRSPRTIGLIIEDIPEEIARFLGLKDKSGALVAGVEPGSPAFEAGLTIGDIILRADTEQIRSAKDFTQLAKKLTNQELTMLYVQRGPDEKLFIALKQQLS